jgi:hypothetical protein
MTRIMGIITRANCQDRISRKAIVALLFACSASGLAAATLCVSPGAKSGCKGTISAAVAVSNPGDTIQALTRKML